VKDPPGGGSSGDCRGHGTVTGVATTRTGASRDRMPGWVPKAIAMFWLGFAALWLARGVVHSLRSFFLVLLISLFLSFAIEPAVNRLERAGLRRGAGTGLVFLLITLAIVGFGFAVGTVLAEQLTTFTDDAPAYIDDLEKWLQDNVDESIEFDDLQDEFTEGGAIRDWAQRAAENALDFGAAILSIILQIFTVALFTFYLVADGPRLRRQVCSLLPPERQREVLRAWDLAIEKTGGYIASRAVLAVLSALFHWMAFAIIGVPFPLPLALWVGVLSQFIPVVGTYIAGAVPVVIALIDSPATGLWVLGFVVLYQQLENYLFLPRVTARTMEMHVAVAFGAVIVGSALLGPIGAVLALPAAATGQAFISSYVNRHEVDEAMIAQTTMPRTGRRFWQRSAPPDVVLPPDAERLEGTDAERLEGTDAERLEGTDAERLDER
jgi:predicted PurR-regulated permease PerM